MKRCTMILLTVCLLLTACGRKTPAKTETMPADETVILMTVDGRKVPAWRYLCWLRYACDRVRERYAAEGQAVDWDMMVDGEPLGELVKQWALADTVLYATVENWAEQYGCVPSGDETTVPLPLAGLSPQQERELQAVGQVYAALYDLCCTEGSALAPSQEELESFAEERGLMTLDRILIAAGEDREAARQRAAEVFSRLNGADSPAKAFSALAAEGDDPAGPRQSEDGGWDETLLEAARSLAPGQYSGILESDEGFSILMRLEGDLSGVRELYFDALLQQAAESAEVILQPLYEELTPEKTLSEEGKAA